MSAACITDHADDTAEDMCGVAGSAGTGEILVKTTHASDLRKVKWPSVVPDANNDPTLTV